MTISRPSIKVTTKQIVTRDTSMKPYVGFEHPTDLPDGWKYGIKRWSSPFDLRLPSLPRLSDPSIQGVSESTYFRSGVGSAELGDLFVEDFEEVLEDGERHWFPEVRHGQYFRYRTSYFYYGDNSRVQYVNPTENRDSRNYIELNAIPDIGSPILAATFKRTNLKEAIYKTKINQRYNFTGTYSGGEELDTVSDIGKITWANVDTTKKEFIVDNTIDTVTRLWFNRDYTETFGVVPTVYTDLGTCEYLGLSTGSPWQVFYLPHFPVLADSSFHLYVATSTTWEEWTRVETWWELISTNWSYSNRNRYFLDKDLGVVYFGAADNGGIPIVGRHVVAAYTTTLRIEFEELDKETKIIALDADVNPVSQSVNQGFVCISHADIEPASISLSINKSATLNTDPKEYGPIVIGSDYAILKATVMSSSGIPVSSVEVNFEMTPTDLGYLAGSSLATSVTDASGKGYTNYQPPTSADSLGFYTKTVRDSTNPYYPGDREVILKVADTGLTSKEDDIYLYQILKDDIIMGYETVAEFLQSLWSETHPDVVSTITVPVVETALGDPDLTSGYYTQVIDVDGVWYAISSSVKNTIYRHDGGTTWTAITNVSIPLNPIFDFLVHIGDEIWVGDGAATSLYANKIFAYNVTTGIWRTLGLNYQMYATDGCLYDGDFTYGGWAGRVIRMNLDGSSPVNWDLGNPSATVVKYIDSIGGDLFVCGYTDVQRYLGGTSWQQLLCPYGNEILQMKDWNGTLIVLTIDTVNRDILVYKYDGGTSWTQLGSALVTAPLWGIPTYKKGLLAVDSNNVIYASVELVYDPAPVIYKYDESLDSWSENYTLTTSTNNTPLGGEFNSSDELVVSGLNEMILFKDGYTTTTTTPAVPPEWWKSEMIEEHDLEDWVDAPEGTEMNGRKVVVYQISSVDNTDPYAVNPIDGTLGAVVPLRPYLAEKITTAGDTYEGLWRLIYPAGSIPDCGPSSLFDIGGYWAVASKVVTFRASCWSPYYNRYIYSDTIRARITLPRYLLGEYLNDLGKIPFGWKILSDTDNVAAGLDGATFITINPHDGPYPVIDLVEGTGSTGDYAQAPFRTLSFGFTIN